jgi:hypothetical protein
MSYIAVRFALSRKKDVQIAFTPVGAAWCGRRKAVVSEQGRAFGMIKGAIQAYHPVFSPMEVVRSYQAGGSAMLSKH